MRTHAPKSDLRFAEAIELIETSKYRLTQPRILILKEIFKRIKPFSASDLATSLSRKRGCDLVTIYRSLPIFEQLGVIERCDFSDEMAYYEVRLGHQGHHHHHIVCKLCKKIEALEFCIVDGQEQLLKKLGYTNLSHRLEFAGICPGCSEI